MSEPRDTGWARLSSVRIGAVVALAVAAAFVIWLVVRRNDDSSSATTTTTTSTASVKAIGPKAATAASLRTLSTKSVPIYWAGPRQGQTYELTRLANGNVYVRYLPSGAKLGNERAAYTIVGTYPKLRSLKVLKNLAKQSGEKSASIPGGGIAVYASSKPTNVYVAYPRSDVQIEVFDPSAARALRLATSGRVVRVD